MQQTRLLHGSYLLCHVTYGTQRKRMRNAVFLRQKRQPFSAKQKYWTRMERKDRRKSRIGRGDVESVAFLLERDKLHSWPWNDLRRSASSNTPERKVSFDHAQTVAKKPSEISSKAYIRGQKIALQWVGRSDPQDTFHDSISATTRGGGVTCIHRK